jgi:mannitol/fructose-specific phosphotransferase system IIA component (Ntr-type)
MATKLDNNDVVFFKEMLMANSIMVDALAQLLISKGLVTEQEFHRKVKDVQKEYNERKAIKA